MEKGQLVQVVDDADERYDRNACRSPLEVGHVDIVSDTSMFQLDGDVWLSAHDGERYNLYWFAQKSLRSLR